MQDESLGGPILSEGKAYELLEELELSSRAEIAEARGRMTLVVDARIEVRPADLLRRASLLVSGSARKLTRQGVASICDLPVEVGSVFQVTFDRQALDIEPSFAICDRCVMLEPTVFGVRFQFITPIDLSDLEQDPDGPQSS